LWRCRLEPARQASAHCRTVTRLESASRPIRLNELADLAALYGIPVIQFLETQLDFRLGDLDALESEIASVEAEHAKVKADLHEAQYLAMVSAEHEGELRAQMARLNGRLEALMRWHPQAKEARREHLRELMDRGPA
jgi:hypothetical protein